MSTLIKRYVNRKLYNTETKRYITIKEIGELIHCGLDIHVMDCATDEDITSTILTQVITEQEKNGANALPNDLLAGIIRAQVGTLELMKLFLSGRIDWAGFMTASGIPTREDIKMLNQQIDSLTRVVD